MPGYQHINLEKNPETHIGKLTLDRPDKRNALNDQTMDELGAALEDIEAEDAIRVLIVTGAGQGFCAGGDLEALPNGSEPGAWASDNVDDIRRSFKRAQRFMLCLQRMEKPVIAMVNGPAVGAGFDIACACDLRVGSPLARFMVAYIRIGLFPGFGGTWLYPRMLGSIGKAAEMLFTGDYMEAEEAYRLGFLNKLVPEDELEATTMEAEEAYRLGFLNKLVPEDELEATTMEMARKIANGPPVAMRLSKLMLYKGLEFDLDTAMRMAAAAETITLTSQDHLEGTTAIRESRRPAYEGR
jgi:enoyl-CoA hydratase/carnithine racemase